MAAQLEKGHGLLAAQDDVLKLQLDATVAKLDRVVAGGAQEPSAPPGLINQQLEYLQTAVGGLVARLQSAESKADTGSRTHRPRPTGLTPQVAPSVHTTHGSRKPPRMSQHLPPSSTTLAVASAHLGSLEAISVGNGTTRSTCSRRATSTRARMARDGC